MRWPCDVALAGRDGCIRTYVVLNGHSSVCLWKPYSPPQPWDIPASMLQVSHKYLVEEGRHNYTTPKSFLELIDFYKELLRAKRGELGSNISRLANGLKTLRKTNDDVQVRETNVCPSTPAQNMSATQMILNTLLSKKYSSTQQKVQHDADSRNRTPS